jgi:ectoine hydroxylase-related dioxygenase (phytanoyl-CoA dioxygenase family)
LGIPTATVRNFPPRLQELVGYGIYNGIIGHIDKQVPANLLLAAEGEDHLLWDYVPPATG